jgi:hypothetical protein
MAAFHAASLGGALRQVRPGRLPSSRSAWRTQLRSVSGLQPILLAIDVIVAHTASCARSGDQTPSEQLARGPQVKTCGSFASSWLPLSQKLEPPKIPVRFGFRGLVIVFVRGCLDLPAGVNECHRPHNSYEGSPPRPCLRRCATADVKFWF